MTDNEGDPGLIFNLDCIPSPIAAIVHRAIAETPDGPVWITENGKRIAAIVSKETTEALVKLHNTVQDIEELLGPETNEDFGPFIAALKSLRAT